MSPKMLQLTKQMCVWGEGGGGVHEFVCCFDLVPELKADQHNFVVKTRLLTGNWRFMIWNVQKIILTLLIKAGAYWKKYIGQIYTFITRPLCFTSKGIKLYFLTAVSSGCRRLVDRVTLSVDPRSHVDNVLLCRKMGACCVRSSDLLIISLSFCISSPRR